MSQLQGTCFKRSRYDQKLPGEPVVACAAATEDTMRKIAAAFVCLLVASLATEASAQYATPQHYYNNYNGYYNHYHNGRYLHRNYYENDIHHGYPGPGVTDPSAR
jgi:hypothetical protein